MELDTTLLDVEVVVPFRHQVLSFDSIQQRNLIVHHNSSLLIDIVGLMRHWTETEVVSCILVFDCTVHEGLSILGKDVLLDSPNKIQFSENGLVAMALDNSGDRFGPGSINLFLRSMAISRGSCRKKSKCI